jgi:hypothetical protein
MTSKQKEAIKVLNDLKQKVHITYDEYFMLLDFVVNNEQQISWIPFQPNTPLTYPQVTYETTCKQ